MPTRLARSGSSRTTCPVITACPRGPGSRAIPVSTTPSSPSVRAGSTPQEGWWRIFRKAALAGRSFANRDDITYATALASNQLNSRAHPWIWADPHHQPALYGADMCTPFGESSTSRPLPPETSPSSGRQGWAGLAVGRRVEVTMNSGSKATCRSSVASAPAGRVSRGASGDEGRTADVDSVVPLGVVLDVVGDKTAVDADLGRTLSQVFQGVAR